MTAVRRLGAPAATFLVAGLALACGAPDAPPDPANDSARGAAKDPGATSAFPVTLRDDAGRELRLDSEPRRIVSLVPAATRVLVALGHRDRLVGRTDFDGDPGLADLPSVGGGLQPSMERLVSLEPDLVVRFRAESDPDTPRRLDAAGIAHLAVRPDRIEDVFRMIELLGRVLGERERARELVGEAARELEEVANRLEGVTPRRGAYLLGGDPPLAAGGGTFLHELMELAGGENALADVVDLYAPVSVEDLVGRELDVVLVTEGAGVPPALRNLPIVRVPREVESPGLEVGASARRLAELLHPDRFR